MAGYPLLPVPSRFQGPSGQTGQVQLDGIAMKISLFHGRVDNEADWHVDIDPDPIVWQTLGPHLRANGVDVTNQGVAVIRSELMVIDRHRDQLFDDLFDSADVTLPLRLSKPGSAHPAWDLGMIASEDQGENHDFSDRSRLYTDGGRVYLQGPLVNDEAHDTKIEIHPLDSIAFAMDRRGRTLSAKGGQAGWPRNFVRWRVAFFTNSSIHRINDEDYLKQERTTTWFLDLPSSARVGNGGGPINRPPGLSQPVAGLSVQVRSRELWNGAEDALYFERGVKSMSRWRLARDPRDGRTKLKISATMERPDRFGGIVVQDYAIRWDPGVLAPPVTG